MRDALDSVTSIAIGLAEALIVIVIARFVHRFMRDKLLHRLDSRNLSEGGLTLINVLSSVVVGVITATLLLALWGVTWSAIFAAIGLGTFGILLGVQDVLKSLIGGLFLIAEKPYTIGDRIQVRDVTGRVIGIELRTTILRSDSGHRIVAPNSIVFTEHDDELQHAPSNSNKPDRKWHRRRSGRGTSKDRGGDIRHRRCRRRS
jgi:small-conductance mechanosensitive channel